MTLPMSFVSRVRCVLTRPICTSHIRLTHRCDLWRLSRAFYYGMDGHNPPSSHILPLGFFKDNGTYNATKETLQR